jgi:hypothetical protein
MKNILFNILLLLMAIPTLAQQNAADLEKAAHEAYQRGYSEKGNESKVKAFEEAAKLFDEAAAAYRSNGDTEKAEKMEGWAKAARNNAEHHRRQNIAQHQYSAVWSRIPITSVTSKMPEIRQSRFHIAFTGGFPVGDISSKNVEIADLQNAAFAPETFEQLFEKLGGEFFIGDPNSSEQQSLEMSGQTQFMPGLRLGVRLGNRFEIRAGGQYFQTKWTGEFPLAAISHFPQDPTQPKTLQGNATASASGFLGETDLAFFLTDGAFRPYLKGGVRGQFPTENTIGADIAGVSLPLEINPVETEFSAFGGAGARWNFMKNGFVDAGATYAKLPGGDFQPALEVGVGWNF